MSFARTGCASSSATASSVSCLFIIFPFIQIITLPAPTLARPFDVFMTALCFATLLAEMKQRGGAAVISADLR
jgi:hypothetical protein